jgi:UDP-N-acetylglucosamine transferase subunit ALG13
MILVIMGMEVHPFDRLARAVDMLQQDNRLGEDFLIQLGACNYVPVHAKYERYMSFGDLCQLIRASSLVVTHAGAGSTLTCIQQKKHPIMVPRRSSEGEHVDDHQLPFTQKMCDFGLATSVYDIADLPDAIVRVRNREATSPVLGQAEQLVGWLNEFWSSLPSRT